MTSASPSEVPTSSFSALGSLQIPFANRAMEITIVGEPGVVLAWRAAADQDLHTIAWEGDADMALGRLSARELVLSWVGTVCDVQATLKILPGRLVVGPAPRKGCDAVGIVRGIVLTFPAPIDPAGITVELGPRVLIP